MCRDRAAHHLTCAAIGDQHSLLRANWLAGSSAQEAGQALNPAKVSGKRKLQPEKERDASGAKERWILLTRTAGQQSWY